MSYGENTSPKIERVATAIVQGIFLVHAKLGPGLLESIYEAALAHEMSKASLGFQRQMVLPVIYDGVKLDAGLRLDFLVEDLVIVEIKSVERHNTLFEAQVLTYLKLTGKRLGILANFNVELIKNGIKRIIL